MAYTAPTGNAVDFSFPGTAYSPPIGNAANLTFQQSIPTVYFLGGSVLSMVARGLFSSSTSISSSAIFVPENPYRDFSISVGSSFSAYTWLRHFSFDSGSSPLYRAGTTATIVSGASFDVFGRALRRSYYTLSSTSVLFGDWRSYNRVKFYTIGNRSVFAGAAVYNKPMQIRINSKSTFAPNPRFTTPASFVTPSTSTFSAVSKPYSASSALIATTSQVSVLGAAITRSAALSYGASELVWASQFSLGGSFSIGQTTLATFTSDYLFSVIPVVPIDADRAYVQTRTAQLTVIA